MSLLHEIWLCKTLTYDPEKIYKYINFFGSAENAYNAKASDYKKHDAYPVLSKIIKAKHDLSDAKLLIEECKRKDIHLMSICDEDYPIYLKNSYLPPRILFIKGERINLNNYITLAMVGSRASTNNGRLMAYDLSQDLTSQGFLVISGLANGIDSMAHKGALAAGGKTIALLAGGVDEPYPKDNRSLYDEIIKNGAVISEQPPGVVGRGYFYQRRNRIMAGLSYGCILVEGCVGSGSSITMKHATSENRDLFAVPGNPRLAQSYIPNSLIKDGATMVIDYNDILNIYEERYSALLENGKQLLKVHQQEEIEDMNYPLDDVDEKIIAFLNTCGEAQFPDTICEACAIPANIAASKLTMLLMGGIISREPGNKYLLIRR